MKIDLVDLATGCPRLTKRPLPGVLRLLQLLDSSPRIRIRLSYLLAEGLAACGLCSPSLPATLAQVELESAGAIGRNRLQTRRRSAS